MDETLTIVHFTKELSIGGVERNIESIARYLSLPFRHEVICLFGSEHDERCEAFLQAGVPVFFLHGSLEQLPPLLKTRSYAAALFHRSGQAERCWSAALNACRAAGVAAIFEYSVFSRPDTSSEDVLIDRHFHKSMTSYLQFIERAQRIGYARTDRHTVLYNATDIERFTRHLLSDAEREAARRDHGIDRDSFVLLRIGRSDPRKWGDFLLDVIPSVLRRIPNAQFVLRTAPKSRAKWIRAQPWSGRVLILPPTVDDRELAITYQVADLLTHSSRRGETFGNTIPESFMFGVPAVVHATPWRDNGQIETVDHMVNGIVANTPADYAEAIVHLAQDRALLRRFGQCAREKVERYAAPLVAQSLGRHMLDVLGSRVSPRTAHLEGTHDWKIYPTQDSVRQYVRDYPQRLRSAWSTATPVRGGTLFSRGQWFARDAFEILTSQAKTFVGNYRSKHRLSSD